MLTPAMFMQERHERALPFPNLSGAVKAGYAAGDLTLRPFGLYESDLNVDFDRTPRPVLVTHLLECCTRDTQQEKVEQNFFWHLSIGKRIECLLTLLRSEAGPGIPIAFRCPNETCEEKLEIEISTDDAAALQEESYAAHRVDVPLENEVLVLRRPTGGDQLAWLKGNFKDRSGALMGMLRTLMVEATQGRSLLRDALDDQRLQSIERAMEEQDPLINFRLTVRCPSCETENPVAIDLEELALRRLRQAQTRLLASVHRLASHYHWSEQQIFSVPYWRRVQYLSLIENEKNR